VARDRQLVVEVDDRPVVLDDLLRGSVINGAGGHPNCFERVCEDVVESTVGVAAVVPHARGREEHGDVPVGVVGAREEACEIRVEVAGRGSSLGAGRSGGGGRRAAGGRGGRGQGGASRWCSASGGGPSGRRTPILRAASWRPQGRTACRGFWSPHTTSSPARPVCSSAGSARRTRPCSAPG